MKNSALYNKYTCDICQNNFLFKFNESNINDPYINCFELKESFYSSEILFNIISDVTFFASKFLMINCKYEFSLSNN